MQCKDTKVFDTLWEILPVVAVSESFKCDFVNQYDNHQWYPSLGPTGQLCSQVTCHYLSLTEILFIYYSLHMTIVENHYCHRGLRNRQVTGSYV